ncbi:hypothetical protein RFN58_04505 [Streptomyces iakyrus]|uniref:hypothetical protein n=1 Tax=Streptomyces iakyrus TaxID=68219 RepID=UPI00052539B3|nr:hypothetical protein [Streptomyces iakyrus]
MSVLTERVNASSVLAELPLRSDRAQQMDELAPVLATPAIACMGFASVSGPSLAVAGSKQPS